MPYILPITSSEIEDEISGLKSGKTAGPSSIHTEILKLLKLVISKPLEIIFNTSFSTGTVPSNFRLANVVPVFKKGSQTCLTNYRPISLLSIFNKLIEKLMYKRLIRVLEKNNILFHKQFGFRSGYSTDHAIICITDKIQRAIENRNYSCGIFLDFSKAFDTVNYDILLMKLANYGIRGIANEWFKSYLSDRRQTVSVNSAKSVQCNVTCGGSVLGPLLFLICINDSDLFDFHLFADDSNLLCEHKNILNLEKTINNELCKVHALLCANRLSLNIDKSNFVIFHPPQKNVQGLKLNLKINDQQLNR